MPAAFYVARSIASDPAKRTTFDKWYQNEHLPDANLTLRVGVRVIEATSNEG
jgi:hypothetical protein